LPECRLRREHGSEMLTKNRKGLSEHGLLGERRKSKKIRRRKIGEMYQEKCAVYCCLCF